jgi:hypothetical protein
VKIFSLSVAYPHIPQEYFKEEEDAERKSTKN